MQLRNQQALVELEEQFTIVFPLPLDLIARFIARQDGEPGGEQDIRPSIGDT